MSSSLFTHHPDFKNPSFSAQLAAADSCSSCPAQLAAENCSNAMISTSSTGINSSLNSSSVDYLPSDPNNSVSHAVLHRYPLQAAAFSLSDSFKPQYGFHGELLLQRSAPPTDCSTGQHFASPPSTTHVFTAPSASAAAPQRHPDYIIKGGSNSTFTSNQLDLQKDLNGGRNVPPSDTSTTPAARNGGVLRSSTDYAEKINDLREALLRRSVSRPASFLQKGQYCFDVRPKAADCDWRHEQQQSEEDAKSNEVGGSFLCKEGVQDFHGEANQQVNYLGRLRAAAASVGSLSTSPAAPGAGQNPASPSNLSDQANYQAFVSFTSEKESSCSTKRIGVCPSQAPAMASISFKQSLPSDLTNAVANNEGDSGSINGSVSMKETSAGSKSSSLQAPSHLQGASAATSAVDHRASMMMMGDFRPTATASYRGNDDISSRDFMKLHAATAAAGSFAKDGTVDSNEVPRPAAGDSSLQTNQAFSPPTSHELTHAAFLCHSLGANLSPYNHETAPSSGGFTKLLHSPAARETAYNGLRTDSRPFCAGTTHAEIARHFDQSSTAHDHAPCTSLNQVVDGTKSAEDFDPADQASMGSLKREKQAELIFLKEEANFSKLKIDMQADQELRDYGSLGNLKELERLQQAGRATPTGVSDDPLQADGSCNIMGDLQASIMAQEAAGSCLQRFLPSNDEEACQFEEEELCMEGALFGSDEFRMYEFKVRLCMRERSHDWTQCPFAHPGEKARRRDPRLYHYSAVPCPDFRKAACKRGDGCELSHGVFECWLHPSRYRTQICKDGKLCKRKVCFFAHSPSQFRAIASSNSTTHMHVSPASPLLLTAQCSAQNIPISQNYDGSSLRLLQHLPHYYQALLKQDLNVSKVVDPNPSGSSQLMPTLMYHHAVGQHQHGGLEAAGSPALPVLSFENSPLWLAMAYGPPINVDAATLENFNSNRQSSVSSPGVLNMPSSFDHSFGLNSGSGFLCCKNTSAANIYANRDDLVSMHTHNSFGSPNSAALPHLQTDGTHVRTLQQLGAASINGVTRPIILNGGVCNGFIPINNELAALSTMQRNSAHLTSSDLHPQSMFSQYPSANWNHSSASLPQFMPINVPAAPVSQLDAAAVSQAQAVLTAHALSQNRASQYEHHMPSITVLPHAARHHLDTLTNGAQGPMIPSTPLLNINSTEYMNDQQHLQNAGRGLAVDSPQAMTQLLESIQQLELRCATAEMKNSLMMAQAAAAQKQSAGINASSYYNPSIAKPKGHQLESCRDQGLPESRTDPYNRPVEHVGTGGLKLAEVGALSRQDSACTPNIADRKGCFDLGWVDELI